MRGASQAVITRSLAALPAQKRCLNTDLDHLLGRALVSILLPHYDGCVALQGAPERVSSVYVTWLCFSIGKGLQT